MPRISRIVSVNFPHHIAQRGNNRQAVFMDDGDRMFYLALLKKYSQECGSKVRAYCLMKNHIHILMVPQRDDSLAKTMQKLSLTFTQYINKKYKRTGRLWECRFYSSLVDRDSYLWEVCRYIEKNPVRANIVKDALDYKWSSAIANTTAHGRGGLVEPIWKDYLNRDEYVRFLQQADNEEQIRKIRNSVLRGIPTGSEEFVKKMAKKLNIIISTRRRGRPRKEEK